MSFKKSFHDIKKCRRSLLCETAQRLYVIKGGSKLFMGLFAFVSVHIMFEQRIGNSINGVHYTVLITRYNMWLSVNIHIRIKMIEFTYH